MGVTKYYDTYEGHSIDDLTSVKQAITNNRQVVYLAGDSSMDNKFWIPQSSLACNGYESVLSPPESKEDICYWMNFLDPTKATINCAVEESKLANRKLDLLDQDKFIRDNITGKDVIVVSVGGNDICLSPSFSTIFNFGVLLTMPESSTAYTNSFNYLVGIFKNDTEEYIRNLTVKCHPSMIVVCMIYFPCSKGTGWADMFLGIVGYSKNPSVLQNLITKIYNSATKEIRVNGIQIKSVPLFEVLDPEYPNDYVSRVEPSSIGGRKIAERLISEF